ncbi:MAG: glycosyltransferase, partial [Ignisphaera sp.]|nr:glycosyltransferase [Ignisphaera sp.]
VVTEQVMRLERGDLYQLYRAADVYVHPALCEGFGIPIVEAMAAGKPVICVDAPPMNEHVSWRECLVRVDRSEVVDRGIVSFRMNFPDLRDMAEKIDWIVYAGREVWDDIGARNVEIARKRYGLSVYREFQKYV